MNEQKELKILCPFCNAPYTARMENALDSSSGCETCGSYEATATLKIYCDNCNKLVYEKEYGEYDL